ncbi:hypothetical protein [[Mycobacterium] burgundiense]|uniref:Secreted protein n=1 Tax=[Mycobacterium] burgundiense TaxID=3064286 RepID=A0ABM9L9Z9_9MYCO|nr:hypothetical protein [Mycolicibacterium sp. MU0053]CAJ1495458.1 hypothetical protein MU0053_000391 [Mycolicibacterium sp. MU0053]
MQRRLTSALAGLLLLGSLMVPATATAASDGAVSSIPVDPVTQLEQHINADCVLAEGRCFFNTRANLLTPDGPIPLPPDTWARQTITLRSMDRNVWQEAEYSAPAHTPRSTKGANHDNVLSKMLRSLNNVEISVTYFGGGSFERFQVDGSSVPTDWTSGRPATGSDFIACSTIHVVYGAVNITSPNACAHTKF